MSKEVVSYQSSTDRLDDPPAQIAVPSAPIVLLSLEEESVPLALVLADVSLLFDLPRFDNVRRKDCIVSETSIA